MNRESDETRAGDSRSLTEAVIEAVAEAKDVEETAFEPLYEVIDPDALEGLFERRRDGTPRTRGRLVFTLAGCEVVVHADEAVEVTSSATTGSSRTTIGETGRERDRAGSVPEDRG